jgi:hypothetical protein
VNHRGHHLADASCGEFAFPADRAADSTHAQLLYRALALSSTGYRQEFAVEQQAKCEGARYLFAAKSQSARRRLHKQAILRMMQVRHGEQDHRRLA